MTSDRGFAVVEGSPGTRVRFAGIVRLFWPFAVGMFVAGYLARCGLPSPDIAPGVAGLALLALAGLAWWSHGKAIERLGSFLKGARGEELVARELALLPDVFHVFHGIRNPAGGDFDHVVVGPRGVALIETKHWSGPVTYAGGELLARSRRPTRSPIAQVRRGASQLQRHLASGGRTEVVWPVICLAGNSFEEERLDTDGLMICNARTLCALLLARLGSDAESAAFAPSELCGILRALVEGAEGPT